jgi:hypothetical protein
MTSSLSELYELMIKNRHPSKRGGYWLMFFEDLKRLSPPDIIFPVDVEVTHPIHLFGKLVVETKDNQSIRFVGSCFHCAKPAIWDNGLCVFCGAPLLGYTNE